MSSITLISNVIGSTFVVTLYELDQDKLIVSFTLTKDNHYICFLNFGSSLLKHQICESYNVFVNLPKGACKKFN